MNSKRIATTGVSIVALFILAMFSFETVPTGEVKVGTKFGRVVEGAALTSGFHFPVNPILSWDRFDIKERTELFRDILVPAADQQKATMDVSVQFSINPASVENMRANTGVEAQAISVHFDPIVRGALRDAGRSTPRVEDFYDDAKIASYTVEALTTLSAELAPKGFVVTDVIVRDVDLPQVIKTAIEAKKKREQEVEQQRAELARVDLEAQQKVVQANSDLEAAKLHADAVRVKADADAHKIKVLQAQLARSPQYIELVRAERWDGVLPRFTGGGAVPFINIGDK